MSNFYKKNKTCLMLKRAETEFSPFTPIVYYACAIRAYENYLIACCCIKPVLPMRSALFHKDGTDRDRPAMNRSNCLWGH